MSKVSEKIRALEKVAKKWSDSGISWAVANGLEDYPHGVGRDLDVLIEKGRLKQAVQVVIDVLLPMNWIVLPNLQGWIWWVVAFRRRDDGTIDSLQIDLFEHLQWAFTRVVADVGADGPLEERGPFFEDPGAAVAKRFLLNGLSSGIKTFEKKPHYLEFTKPELTALSQVLVRISGRDWPTLRSAAAEGNLNLLESELSMLRKAAYRHAIASPGKWTRFVSALQKQWVVNFAPKQGAPVIEVRIADRSRSEEVVEFLVHEIESLVYHRVEVIDESQRSYSAIKLRKLSCLQVVLIFCNTSVPAGLKSDLSIVGDENHEVIKISSGEVRSPLVLSQSESLRSSLLSFFEIKSSQLFQKHSLSFP